MDLSDDEALLEEFRKTRDPAIFKSLVRRYQSRIYNSSFRILGRKEEAEEVVQETCIRIHQSVDSFSRTSSISFAAWIFRIAHNNCYDIIRERNKKKSGSALTVAFDPLAVDQETAGGGTKVVSQISDPRPNPAERLDRNEQTEFVAEMLNHLPDTQRIALVLHDVEGFSYQEVAEIVGEKLGTVRSRIHYGRLRLKELLDPYYSSSTLSQPSR